MNHNIIITEDDHLYASVLGRKLTQQGCNVTIVEDGKELLHKIKEVTPDFLLLDISLPHLNGLDALEEIRKDDSFQNLPVIVLTNIDNPLEREKAKNLGAKDYLVKAEVTAMLVVEKLHKFLENNT